MMQVRTPPTTPTPPTQPVVAGQGTVLQVGGSSPNAVYEGYRNQRDELGRQLERLERQREEISQQLQQPDINTVNEKALETRLASVDQRIASTEQLIADADAKVASSAAVPGAVVPPPPYHREGPPEEVFVLTGIFMFLMLPIIIAYARRVWRRSAQAVTKLPQEIYDRFARVDQSLDAIAIEVERVGEGQRFLTKMYSDQQRALSAGPAERIESSERERERQARK